MNRFESRRTGCAGGGCVPRIIGPLPALCLAGFVHLLVAGPVLAGVVNVNGGGIFVADGANQFGAGPATVVDVGFASDPLFLGFQFDTGHIGFDGIAGSEPFAFGVAFDARFAGRAGLEVGYYFDSGSVDARYPFQFGYQYTDTAGIEAAIDNDPQWNRMVPLSPQFDQSGETYLRTTFPQVGAYADFVVSLEASARVEGCVFGCVGFDLVPGFLRHVDERQELLSFNRPDPLTGDPDGDLRIFGLNTVPFSPSGTWGGNQQPTLDDPSQTRQSGKAGGGAGIVVEVTNIGFDQPISVAAGVGYGPVSATTELANMTLRMPKALDMEASTDTSTPVTRLAANASDSVLDLRLDIDGLAGAVVPFLPPGEVNLNLGPATLNLNLIDYELGPQLQLAQSVSLAPEPTLSLQFDQNINVQLNGEPLRADFVNVRLGVDEIAIQFPNRELQVTPSFTLNPKFSNDLDLDLTLSQTLKALSMGASFAGAEIFGFGPLITREDELARTKLADLVDTRFDLTGQIESPVNLQLAPFTLGEGWRLSGESAAVPRNPAEILADGSSHYSFRFDATDLAAGAVPVYVSYFGSKGDTYRAFHDETVQECAFWLFGCLDWDTVSQERTTRAIYAAHTDDPPSPFPPSFTSGGRTYSIVNPADSLVELPDQTPLRIATSAGADLVPLELQDYHHSDSWNFAGILRGSEHDHVYYSDLVDSLQSTRYDGFGLTDPVYLAFPLLDTVRDGDEYVTRFASSVDFDISDFDFGPGHYEFESLTLPGSRFNQLLGALGDTDGIGLEVWDQALGDWVRLADWVPATGLDFHFNFYDDFLRSHLGPDAHLAGPMGGFAADGVSGFRLSGLDFDPTLFTGVALDDLLGRFGPGGSDLLVAGITVTDLVSAQGLTGYCRYYYCSEGPDLGGLHGPLPGTGPLGSTPFGPLGAYYAGTTETVLDPTRPDSPGLDVTVRARDTVELARGPVVGPPQPESGLGGRHLAPVPPERVPPEGAPACSGEGCESTPILDPTTGQVVELGTGMQELVDKGYLNPTGEPKTGQHPPAPPAPGDPDPVPGSHPGLALDPTGRRGADVFVFDFAKVDFGGEGIWGGFLDEHELVFHAGASLADGTACRAATGSFADGQVVSRSVVGARTAYIRLDTGGRSAAEFAPCFSVQRSTAIFGQEAPVYLGVPYAPTYDFWLEGPLFTAFGLPYAGSNALLTDLVDLLLFDDALGDYMWVASLGAGDWYDFSGEGVDRFRLAGLDLPFFWLDHDPSIRDANPRLLFGFTLSEPGTVIFARVSGFPHGVPEPGPLMLMAAGLLVLAGLRLPVLRRPRGRLTSRPATPSAASVAKVGWASWARWRPRRPGPDG